MATYGRYVWTRASNPGYAPALVPGIDPEHVNPDPDPNTDSPLWVSSAPAPMLSDEIDGGASPASPVGGGGPWNATPNTHTAGQAGSAPMTVQEAQAARSAAMGQDFGAVAAKRWRGTTFRDGAPHVALIDDIPGQGDSPETLQYKRTGVGQPNDPYARNALKTRRWWDRVIDMHWFDVSYRPMLIRNAAVVQNTNPPASPTQYDSPFVSVGPYEATADRFVSPSERRQPRPWDELQTQDTSGGNEFGLTRWGL